MNRIEVTEMVMKIEEIQAAINLATKLNEQRSEGSVAANPIL